MSGERHAEPDGEQSLAPRPGHVASPGAGWAGGPPLCPCERAGEAASVWADGPGGCTHAHAPAPRSTASPPLLWGPPGRPGVHHTEEETEARDGRDPGQDAQPPDAQTACSWDPPPWQPRPRPGGESGYGSRPSHRSPWEEAAGGGGLHRAPWFIDQRQPSIC